MEGTRKTNTTYQITSLLPWNRLPVANLTTTAGRGYYRTNFTLDLSQDTRKGTASGAIIDLGPILHTAVLYVNDQNLPPLDVTSGQADITAYVRYGRINTVQIVVSSPLGNALIPYVGRLRTVSTDIPGTNPFTGGSLFTSQDYGLVGEVKVVPYDGIVL